MQKSRIVLAALAAAAVVAVGAAVAFAAPQAVGNAASPSAAAGRAEYCPDKKARQQALTSFIRNMQRQRKAYFRTHPKAKQRKAFLKAQQAELRKRQRALAQCD